MERLTIISPKRAYLYIAIPMLTVVCWSVFNFPLYTFDYAYDFWEHSATIREWTRNLWHPGNPHLSIATGTPRFMPFFFLLAVLAKTFHLNPIQALGIGGVLSTVLFLCGVWLFLRLYFRNDWAPFVGLIVLLTGWGVGWEWSNLYQLRSLFYTIIYPSSFAFGLALLSFWLATKVLRQGAITFWNYITIGFISAVMLLSHPPTGAFAIGSLCLLALLEPKVSFSLRGKLVATVLTGALMAELWPYFSVLRIISGTSGGQAESWVESGKIVGSRAKMLYWSHPFYDPLQVLVTLGPAILGIVVLIYLIFRRKHLFIVAGCTVMILPYVVNAVFPIPLGHRFLFFAVFYLHLALVWFILTVVSNPSVKTEQGGFTKPRNIKTIVLVCFFMLCLLWNVTLTVLDFAGYRLKPDLKFKPNFYRVHSVVDEMHRLSVLIPNDAIILAPIKLSWPLPTFTGKVVALFHPNPMVTDRLDRRRDTFKFFQGETLQEDRLKIIRRYNVTHILYPKEDVPEVVGDALNSLGTVASTIDNYVVVKLQRGL